MRAFEFLIELRQGLDQYLKQQFPDWPEYVVRDFLYKNIKDMPPNEMKEWLDFQKKDLPIKQWKLENLKITQDIFDAETQKRLNQRQGGSSNPFNVPKDAERHATQATMIQKQGISKEPIIVIKRGNQYELLEGWHRTIQHLKSYPNGYTGPAWVGYL
jgi:hypothetical protein